MGSLKGLCSAHFAEEIAGSHIVATGKWRVINLWMQCSGKDQLVFLPQMASSSVSEDTILEIWTERNHYQLQPFRSQTNSNCLSVFVLFSVSICSVLFVLLHIAYSPVLLHIAYKAYTYNEAYMPTCRCMLCLMESGFAVSEDTIF